MQHHDDWLGTRGDFPIADRIAYLDNAFIGPLAKPVRDAGIDWLTQRAGDETDVYAMLDMVNTARSTFARMIGAGADEVGFLYTTSEADNVITRALDLKPGDNIVTTDLAYPNVAVLGEQLRAEKGVDFRVVRHSHGSVLPEDFLGVIDARTRLVSVPWVSNINGFRQDVKALARITHDAGAYLYVDAIQLVGTEPVDVVAEDIDFLCCGSYKWLMAGWGIAPFYVRRSLLDTISPDRYGWQTALARTRGGAGSPAMPTAAKFEYASPSFDQFPVFLAALRYLETIGLDRVHAHSRWLTGLLRSGLDDLGFDIFTPSGNRAPSLSYWTGLPEKEVEAIFRSAGIRVGFATGSRTAETYGHDAGRSRVRISPAHYNTSAEILRLLDVASGLPRYRYAGTEEAFG